MFFRSQAKKQSSQGFFEPKINHCSQKKAFSAAIIFILFLQFEKKLYFLHNFV